MQSYIENDIASCLLETAFNLTYYRDNLTEQQFYVPVSYQIPKLI
ncbi:MAG: hypothetical protein ACI9Q9_001426 [Flavobacterium sp.]|jgi:hypothetical protein